ncbi:MAG TPA: LysR family transcriptional regulator [Steroidobacteraceae bacterium]|nr:LysR family transcriptional regulator [Steroidobacteraceae bacterium]
MPMKLDDISAFAAVVETGSVSAAARRLGVAKSVVSKRVSELERGLGATLLKRSPRSVMLTDRGRTFYERGRAILAALDEAASAVREADGELRGLLRIAAPMTFGTMYLGDMLWPLLREHPALEVAIDLDDRVVDLLGSGYDLGIRVGALADSSLIGRKLADIPSVLCASPAYLARAGMPPSLEALPEHDCIGYAHLAAGQVWQFQPQRGSSELRTVRVKSRFVANNGELMRGAAMAGLGLLLVPEFIVADALRAGRLVRVLPACRPTPTALHALYPRDRHGAPRVRAVVERLVAAMRPRPPWESVADEGRRSR